MQERARTRREAEAARPCSQSRGWSPRAACWARRCPPPSAQQQPRQYRPLPCIASAKSGSGQKWQGRPKSAQSHTQHASQPVTPGHAAAAGTTVCASQWRCFQRSRAQGRQRRCSETHERRRDSQQIARPCCTPIVRHYADSPSVHVWRAGRVWSSATGQMPSCTSSWRVHSASRRSLTEVWRLLSRVNRCTDTLSSVLNARWQATLRGWLLCGTYCCSS